MPGIAILPAAGRSTRVGRPKLLLPWGEVSLVEHVLGVWRASHVDHVLLVIHVDDTQLASLAARTGATVVVAHVAPVDMKASLILGIQYAQTELAPALHDPWLVAPADMPAIETAVIDELLAGYALGPPRVVVPAYEGRRGHPIVLPWSLASEVSALGDGEGIDVLIGRVGAEIMPVRTAGVLEDVDTLDDYHRLQARYSPQ